MDSVTDSVGLHCGQWGHLWLAGCSCTVESVLDCSRQLYTTSHLTTQKKEQINTQGVKFVFVTRGEQKCSSEPDKLTERNEKEKNRKEWINFSFSPTARSRCGQHICRLQRGQLTGLRTHVQIMSPEKQKTVIILQELWTHHITRSESFSAWFTPTRRPAGWFEILCQTKSWFENVSLVFNRIFHHFSCITFLWFCSCDRMTIHLFKLGFLWDRNRLTDRVLWRPEAEIQLTSPRTTKQRTSAPVGHFTFFKSLKQD